ncbi:endonuclease domain-containing protein [Sandarakinorhabdus sp.]|uniref:endonuclease domain-containing protein n=1 Tax=Sandarakinorhabdus sp. TaxID=1916663 RepID=UPI00286E5F47|nr:endonuclease domain-containing protein [Sandarakinorhabdus sp.]
MTDNHSRLLLDRARTMRSNTTPSERSLWTMLGGSRLGGMKFRRQAVIGNFIVDFLCPALALVVEVDGDSHDQTDRDAQRDRRLQSMGYTVLHFANWQVMEQADMVGRAILTAAAELKLRWENGPRNQRFDFPTPNPSPEPQASVAQREGS